MQLLPDGSPPWRRQFLRHGAPAVAASALAVGASAPAGSTSATAPRPAAPPPRRPGQQHLRHGASASNKPHPAEKITPVWLAIWRTWAGFANSQLLPDAAALSSMQGPPRSGNFSAQTSASLHPSRSASLAGPSHSRGHGRPRSVRKSYRLREKCLFTELLLLRQTQICRPTCADCLRHLRISAG